MKRIVHFCVVCIALALLAPIAASAGPEICFVNAPALDELVPLRIAPEADADIVCSFFTGVGLEIINEEGDFYEVALVYVPGLPILRTDGSGDDMGPPNGYVAKKDVCAALSDGLDTFYHLLPDARITGVEDILTALYAGTHDAALVQAVLPPGGAYKLLGFADGHALVVVQPDYVWGYVREELVETEGASSGFPIDSLRGGKDAYAGSFPLTFAIVDVEDKFETAAPLYFVYDKVPLYQSPASTSAILEEYACGTTVQVLAEEQDFCRVRTVNQEGYMQKKNLRIEGGQGNALLTRIDYYRNMMSGEEMEILAFPDQRAARIGNIAAIDVSVLGRAGTYYYVEISASWWENDRTYRGFMRPDDRAGQGVNYLEEDRVLGVVILSPEELRTPLLEAPEVNAKKTGTYYHAAQVEILEAVDTPEELDKEDLIGIEYYVDSDWFETGFYRVLVDGREGYMQARHVRILHHSHPYTW